MTAELGADLPLGSAERTISLFLKPSESNNRKFIGYGDTPPGSAFEFTAETYNSEMGVRFRHWGGNYHYGGIALNEWNHVAIRVPADAALVGDVEVFIDGVQSAGVISGGSNIALVSAASLLHVGTAAAGTESGRPFNGLIDDVQFYDESLTDEDIRFLYENPGEIIAQQPRPVHPNPQDSAQRVGLDAQLSWEVAYAEGFSPRYNVYFGTDANALPLVSSEQVERFYDPNGELEQETTYYWRVDVLRIVEPGVTIEYEGPVWGFLSWYDARKVVEWKLEDYWADDGVIYTSDASGHGNDGAIYGYPPRGGPRWVEGIEGDCLEFSRNGEYVVDEDAVELPLDEADEWTMNLYVHLDERTRDWTRIAGFGDSWQRELIIYRDREFAFVNEGEYLLLSGVKAGIGLWHMVTVRRDANGITMFVDGIEANSMTTPISDGQKIDREVNMLSYADGRRFTGKVDEFTVWDGAASSQLIESLAERVPTRGDCDQDDKVGMGDLAEIGAAWHSDNATIEGELMLDDLEGYGGPSDPCVTDLWKGYEGYAGTNILTLTADAGPSGLGSAVMKWDFDFGLGRIVGFDYWLKDGGVDLSQYDELHLWWYKQAGSSGRRLWCKMLNQDNKGEILDMCEAWYAGGLDGLGEDEWTEWVIELSEIHSWESAQSVIPYDRIDNLVGLSIGAYSETGGSGTIYFDDLHLLGSRRKCARESLIEADANGDCVIDFLDVDAVAHDWLEETD
jgi:hypothetical protein